MMVMYYWLVFLIIFKTSHNDSHSTPEPSSEPSSAPVGSSECSPPGCDGAECCPDYSSSGAPRICCSFGQICCQSGFNFCCDMIYGNNAQKNSEMQDGNVNKTVAHNYYDNWWIIIAIVAVIMVVCCGVALCWLKKVKVKAYGHVGKENEAVEEEMELQETQS
eukprot:420278_1